MIQRLIEEPGAQAQPLRAAAYVELVELSVVGVDLRVRQHARTHVRIAEQLAVPLRHPGGLRRIGQLGIDVLISQCLAILCVLPFNFIVNKLWSFREA